MLVMPKLGGCKIYWGGLEDMFFMFWKAFNLQVSDNGKLLQGKITVYTR